MVLGRTCDACLAGYFDLSASNSDGCEDCACHPRGTLLLPNNTTEPCNPSTGQCSCRPEFDGRQCLTCKLGFFPRGTEDCESCHPQCGSSGCVSGSPRLNTGCLSCRNVEHEGVCVPSCPSGTFNNSGVCSACDRLCQLECSGFGSRSCDACLTAELNGTCLDACPSGYFNSNGQCQLCSEQCGSGCFGSNATECFDCKTVSQDGACVPSCLPNHYASATNSTCLTCHPFCDASLGCTGPAASDCGRCSQATSLSGVCLSSCGDREYVDSNRICQACNAECLSCTVSQAVRSFVWS